MAMIRSLLRSVTKASDKILKVAKNNALTHERSAFYTVNYAESYHLFTKKMASVVSPARSSNVMRAYCLKRIQSMLTYSLWATRDGYA